MSEVILPSTGGKSEAWGKRGCLTGVWAVSRHTREGGCPVDSHLRENDDGLDSRLRGNDI